MTKWVGEEELFQAGGKYWSKGDNGTWLKWQHRPYKADLANETQYEQIAQEINGDLEAYVASYRTQAVLGQVNVDDTWDDYLKELDRIGYTRMMDELEAIPSIEDMIAELEK